MSCKENLCSFKTHRFHFIAILYFNDKNKDLVLLTFGYIYWRVVGTGYFQAEIWTLDMWLTKYEPSICM